MASKRREPDSTETLKGYVYPGRRRTDNPLVVGTIVLTLGIIALASILQITATLWAGSQLKSHLEQLKGQEEQTSTRREFLLKSAEAQSMVLRRLCLNVAKDDKEKTECLSIPPAAPTSTPPSRKEGTH